MKRVARNDIKIQKTLIGLAMVLLLISAILFSIGKYMDIQHKKQVKEYAMTKMPEIKERIQELIDVNADIVDIKANFKYDGVNFIELYVADTWFDSSDIQKQRFASDVRDNVKAILFEEGFIKAKDRVGIYVYSYDGISLAESKINGEIKLK